MQPYLDTTKLLYKDLVRWAGTAQVTCVHVVLENGSRQFAG